MSEFGDRKKRVSSPIVADSLGSTSNDTSSVRYSDESLSFDERRKPDFIFCSKLEVNEREVWPSRQDSKDIDAEFTDITTSTTRLTDFDMYTEPDKAQDASYWTYVPKRTGIGRADSPTTCENEPHAFLKDFCLTRQPQLLKPGDTVIHQVQFKCCYRYFSTGAHGPAYFNVNEFVIVKGERGEDLGIVVALFSNRVYLEKIQEEGYSVEDDDFKLRRILRLATKFERSELPKKEIDENNVAQVC